MYMLDMNSMYKYLICSNVILLHSDEIINHAMQTDEIPGKMCISKVSLLAQYLVGLCGSNTK